MSEDLELDGLQGLHRDLVALSEGRLPIVERLALELETKLEDFRSLLHRQKKSDQSRRSLAEGNISTHAE
jgi:nuclear pore complex protein Nup205